MGLKIPAKITPMRVVPNAPCGVESFFASSGLTLFVKGS